MSPTRDRGDLLVLGAVAVLAAAGVASRVRAGSTNDTVTVDLKWSLWSEDQGTWERYAPGVWERMRAAFTGEGPAITVHTAPRKEIRYGTVEIGPGWFTVSFKTEWDTIYELMPEHVAEGSPEEERMHEEIVEWFYDSGLGFEGEDPIGAIVQGQHDELVDFDEMMAVIDGYESDLLEREKANSEAFDQRFRQKRKSIRQLKRGQQQ